MSSWTTRYITPSRSPEELVVPREDLAEVTCPHCGGEEVQRYPVACVLGARMTITCQSCLHVLALERPRAEDNWPPFRSTTYDWEASASERAARRWADAGEGRS
jgi:predicted RNA-binding Zn-ribbon protein involved in translation (DUF1610 family)